eukprot:683135-Rhodomonas_salina.1
MRVRGDVVLRAGCACVCQGGQRCTWEGNGVRGKAREGPGMHLQPIDDVAPAHTHTPAKCVSDSQPDSQTARQTDRQPDRHRSGLARDTHRETAGLMPDLGRRWCERDSSGSARRLHST